MSYLRIKRLFTVLLALFVSSAFARNIEVSLSYCDTLTNKSVLKVDGDNGSYAGNFERSIKAPFGVDGSLSFFIASPFKFFDIGFGVGGGYSTYSEYKLDKIKYDVSNAYEYNVGVGPAFRINLGSRNSLFFMPQAQFNFNKITWLDKGDGALKTKVEQEERSIAVNFNTGYRLWLLKRPGFLLGLNAGAEFTSPLSSICKFKAGDIGFKYKESDAKIFKLYVGLSLNMGKRGVDR